MAMLSGKIFCLKNRKIVLYMIKGHLDMARINIELAESGVCPDCEAFSAYLQFIAESDACDRKTRGYFLR